LYVTSKKIKLWDNTTRAYDHIGVADEVPEGFKEIRPMFKEQ